MKKSFFLLTLLFAVLLFSCNSPETKPTAEPSKIVLHIELDSAGEIKSEEVKQQLVALAKKISEHADRLTLNAYSEQTGSKEKNEEVASAIAYAAKHWMITHCDRAYYNVGIHIKGYDDPINAANPADIVNRRIEFEELK